LLKCTTHCNQGAIRTWKPEASFHEISEKCLIINIPIRSNTVILWTAVVVRDIFDQVLIECSACRRFILEFLSEIFEDTEGETENNL
jgi:cytidine deaminase